MNDSKVDFIEKRFSSCTEPEGLEIPRIVPPIILRETDSKELPRNWGFAISEKGQSEMSSMAKERIKTHLQILLGDR